MVDINADGHLDLLVGGLSKLVLKLGDSCATDATCRTFTDFDLLPDAVFTDAKQAAMLASGCTEDGEDSDFDGVADCMQSHEPSRTEISAISVADFNGDGVLDAVVALASFTTVPGGDYSLPDFPELAGDSKMPIYVLFGSDGDPNHFNSAEPISIGVFATASLATADFNQDGHMDLVVGVKGEESVVMLGDGTGNFQTTIALGTVDATAVAVGDVNQDGLPDVYLGTEAEGNAKRVKTPTLPRVPATDAGGLGRWLCHCLSHSKELRKPRQPTFPAELLL